MKTCPQISDSGFRGKINVVSPGDSAKRASQGRRAGFSHVNARCPPPCKHHLRSYFLHVFLSVKNAIFYF